MGFITYVKVKCMTSVEQKSEGESLKYINFKLNYSIIKIKSFVFSQ